MQKKNIASNYNEIRVIYWNIITDPSIRRQGASKDNGIIPGLYA